MSQRHGERIQKLQQRQRMGSMYRMIRTKKKKKKKDLVDMGPAGSVLYSSTTGWGALQQMYDQKKKIKVDRLLLYHYVVEQFF